MEARFAEQVLQPLAFSMQGHSSDLTLVIAIAMVIPMALAVLAGAAIPLISVSEAGTPRQFTFPIASACFPSRQSRRRPTRGAMR